ERVDSVVEVGQWSLRGGIVDVFSPLRERPVRAEFFGDDVESLRLFDPTTQRSIEALDEITVLPLSVDDDPSVFLSAWLPQDALVVLDDPALLDAPPEDAPSAQPLGEALAGFQRLELPLLQRTDGGSTRIAMGTRSVGGYQGRFKELAAAIREWRVEGFTVRLVVDDDQQGARLQGILGEHDLEPWPGATLWSSEGLAVVTGDCGAGFQPSAWSCLPRRTSSGHDGGGSAVPSSSAAKPSPPSLTSSPTTSWYTNRMASADITASRPCLWTAARAISSCSSMRRAAASTSPWSGSLSSRRTCGHLRARRGSMGWGAVPGSGSRNRCARPSVRGRSSSSTSTPAAR